MPHPASLPAAALGWGVTLEGPFEGRRGRALVGGSFSRLQSGARDRHRKASPAPGGQSGKTGHLGEDGRDL